MKGIQVSLSRIFWNIIRWYFIQQGSHGFLFRSWSVDNPKNLSCEKMRCCGVLSHVTLFTSIMQSANTQYTELDRFVLCFPQSMWRWPEGWGGERAEGGFNFLVVFRQKFFEKVEYFKLQQYFIYWNQLNMSSTRYWTWNVFKWYETVCYYYLANLQSHDDCKIKFMKLCWKKKERRVEKEIKEWETESCQCFTVILHHHLKWYVFFSRVNSCCMYLCEREETSAGGWKEETEE